MKKIALLLLLLAPNVILANSFYNGCLLFIDDYRGLEHELKLVAELNPTVILRSWYRWGEPSSEKKYSSRRSVVEDLSKKGVFLGGGASLSVVNQLDLDSSEFDKNWLSKSLDGSDYIRGNKLFGSLSIPGFRKYLISKALEQVDVGVKELHFGETNGEIHFDDWTIGLKGNKGFIQWLLQRYQDKNSSWWYENFGQFGKAIFARKPVSRKDFVEFATTYPEIFEKNWGKEGSWHGLNKGGEPAFLADLYRDNLDSFIRELRDNIARKAVEDIAIDVWGYSDWICRLHNKPDAIIERFPGKEWGLNWMSDRKFSFEANENRLEGIMKNVIDKMHPVPVIWAIDHPQPFDSFKQLDDNTQATLLSLFAEKCWSLKSNFLIRSYSQELKTLAKKTKRELIKLSKKAQKFKIAD